VKNITFSAPGSREIATALIEHFGPRNIQVAGFRAVGRILGSYCFIDISARLGPAARGSGRRQFGSKKDFFRQSPLKGFLLLAEKE
jgi:hypothetical protein